MSMIDIIRILCIKLEKIDACPKWRFIKRHKLIKDIDKLFNEFFSADIFEQAAGLASIILHLHSNSPEVINGALVNNIYVTNVSLEMEFDNFTDLISHSGKISYIPSKNTFIVDMEANSFETDGYSFSYSEDTALPKNLHSIWANELAPALKYRFNQIIINLAEIINYIDYYRSIEFVND